MHRLPRLCAYLHYTIAVIYAPTTRTDTERICMVPCPFALYMRHVPCIIYAYFILCIYSIPTPFSAARRWFGGALIRLCAKNTPSSGIFNAFYSAGGRIFNTIPPVIPPIVGRIIFARNPPPSSGRMIFARNPSHRGANTIPPVIPPIVGRILYRP